MTNFLNQFFFKCDIYFEMGSKKTIIKYLKKLNNLMLRCNVFILKYDMDMNMNLWFNYLKYLNNSPDKDASCLINFVEN